MSNQIPVYSRIDAVDIVDSPRSATRDAFSRLRVSQSVTLFDSKQIFDKQPYLWDDRRMSGAGTTSTYNTNQASTTLAVAANTAGRHVRQTKRRFRYHPGKSTLVDTTAVLGLPAAGVTRRVGLLDEKNGLFFGTRGTNVVVGLRSFVTGVAVDTYIPQSAWNIDKLDGKGESRLTLRPDQTQIHAVDFQWLGVGGVRYTLNIGGRSVPVHYEEHANLIAVVYMSNPNLPVRYEIENDGTGAAASLTCICASVQSEGGTMLTGIERVAHRDATALTASTTSQYPLVVIRLATGFEATQVIPAGVSIMCPTTAIFLWRVVVNPTYTGTALTYSPIAEGYVEAAVPTNATTVSGGLEIAAGYSQQTNDANLNFSSLPDFSLGVDLAGIADTVALTVQRLGAPGSDDFYGAISWHQDV